MLDRSPSVARRGASIIDFVIYLAGVAALSWAIASVWLGMRAVMDLGGYCASGGPYEISVQCPDSVSLTMFLAFPIGFLGAGLMVWKGDLLGKGYGTVVGLAWPALFLSLGFNFVQFGVAPPDGSHDIVWGWLIPGVIFVLMGGFPLLGWLHFGDHTMVLPGMSARPTPRNYAELAGALREAARVRASAAHVPPASATATRAATAGAPSNLVEGLERLAKLHTDGALDNAEYDQAKRALIDSAAWASLGGTA